MANTIIEADNLIMDFPSVRALDDVSFKVDEGEIFGLLGPDGAGKTTTIRVLATIIKPTSGSVLLWGEDAVHTPKTARGKIGYMSQKFNLYGDLTVEENLRFFADIYRIPVYERSRRMKELLHFARLEQFVDRRAEFLSGGMKQKLALACTLIYEPEILFLDEPTTGVDPVSRREFWAILSELRSRGKTLFVSTPYMDEAERCSTVAFLDSGKMCTINTPKSIKAAFSGEIVELIAKPQKKVRTILERLPYVHDVELFGERLQLSVDNALQVIEILKADLGEEIEIKSIIKKAPTMESAFIELIKSNVGEVDQ